jgi:hypothetical protein
MTRGGLRGAGADRLTVLRTALDNWPLPLASHVNPLADEAVRRQQSWLSRHALADVGDHSDPLVVLQAPRVAALAYPRADLSTLSLAADWTAWFFHFDDYFDEGPLGTAEHRARQTVDFIRDALAGHPRDGAPHGEQSLLRTREAFADLMARTRAIMTDWQSRMFVFHLESYFKALVTEAVNREHDAIPDVRSYCVLRRDTGPARPLLDLVEHTEGIRLPQSFHGSALFGRLMDAAADVAGWINDVFSVSKEQDRGEFHNLVLVLAHAVEIDLVTAVRLAISKIGEGLRFLDGATPEVDEWCLAAGVSEAERLAIQCWVRGLRDFQNHADWYVDHARYATSQHSHDSPGGSPSPAVQALLSSAPI